MQYRSIGDRKQDRVWTHKKQPEVELYKVYVMRVDENVDCAHNDTVIGLVLDSIIYKHTSL